MRYNPPVAWFGGSKKKSKVPEWASDMPDRETFDAWAQTLSEVLDAIGLAVSPREVESGSAQLESGEVVLYEIAERCAAESDRGRWRWLIEEGLIEAGAIPPRETKATRRRDRRAHEAEAAASSPHTFTADGTTYDLANGPLRDIASLLKIQLFSRQSRGSFEIIDQSALVCDEIVDGLWATLVFDFGSHEGTVSRASTRTWQASTAEIWQTGLDNLATEQVTAQQLSSNVLAIMGNGAFVAALVLRLDEVVQDRFGFGPPTECSVVSMPSWHCILLQRFNAPPTEADTDELARLTKKLFESADPLSDELYQSHDGVLSKFTPAPGKRSKRKKR